MEGRRIVTFDRLDQVMPEIDRLLKGHRTLGNWSLGQICNHLTGTFVVAVEGVSAKAPWVVRQTIGRVARYRILKVGRFPAGVRLPKPYEPKPGLDDRAEAEALRASIAYFAAHSGPHGNHPLLGPLDRESWDRFLRIHAAHHLSFVVPEPAGIS